MKKIEKYFFIKDCRFSNIDQWRVKSVNRISANVEQTDFWFLIPHADAKKLKKFLKKNFKSFILHPKVTYDETDKLGAELFFSFNDSADEAHFEFLTHNGIEL
jgi:hypothetical protein